MQNEPPAELVEIAAKVLAPHMEGGREFDQMPADRIALRKWCREGMCSTNDATQDDALEAATAALAAVTPQIEARVVGEIVAWLRGIGFGDADQNRAKFEIMKVIERGEYKESQP